MAMSSAWAWVQRDLAKTTRVCSYDRAGLGWSEAGDGPFMPQSVPQELHALLTGGGERPPYVLAGAEFGAALATLYAARYPDDIAALVLVNPPGAFRSNAPGPSTTFVTIAPWLARTGLLRATRTLTLGTRELPQPSAAIMRAFLNRPDHLTRAARELSRWDETVMLSEAVTLPRSLPVTQVEVEGNDRIALLANRRNALDISASIARAVRDVRLGR